MTAAVDAVAAFEKLSRSFAEAHPALASHLGTASTDADVERLIEAFAALAARVDRLIDASSARAIGTFADVFAPELARPFPSATIVEVEAPRRRLAIPAGAEFGSRPVAGTHCTFTAWSPFDLVPWTIDDVHANADALVLRLVTRDNGREPLASLLPLRLHLTGDPRVAMTLLAYVHRHLADVTIAANGTSISLGPDLHPCGLSASEPLLPPEPFEHPGMRLVREHAILPAKFAFAEVGEAHVGKLNAIASAREVTLSILLREPLPPSIQPTRDNVRLNCVPVVNAFDATAEPIRPTLERPTRTLRVAGIPQGHGEVFALRRVRARCARIGTVDVAPMSDFDAAPGDAANGLYYVARTASQTDGGIATELTLRTVDGSDAPDIDVLSIDVRATNRALASELGVGDVCYRTESSSFARAGLAFRNVCAVTPYRPLPGAARQRRRALTMGALAAVSLADVSALRSLLDTLDLHSHADPQAARAHAQRLEAIREVRTTPRAIFAHDGTRVHGVDVDVLLADGRSYGGAEEGEVFVFAAVLARLFAHEAPLGTFVRTRVMLTESGRVFSFAAASGDTPVAAPLEERID